MTEHNLTKEPQLIADQWMGKCSCGWRTTISFYEIVNRDALLAEIDRRHVEHVTLQKGMDYQQYIRARKLEEHNKAVKRPEFAEGCRRRAERLESEYPEFRVTYDAQQR